MKLAQSLLLLAFLVSCGNPHLNPAGLAGAITPVVTEPETPTEPQPDPERVAKLALGTYSSGCLVGSGARYKVRVTVTETEMKMWYVLFRDSICNAPYYKYFTDYSIEKVIYKEKDNDEDILVDLKRTSYRYVWSHPGYVSRNYCGLTDWTIFVEKEIAGIECDALTDRVDNKIPAIGEMTYLAMKLNPEDPSYLGMPFGKDEPGQTKEDRYGADGDIYTMTLGAY